MSCLMMLLASWVSSLNVVWSSNCFAYSYLRILHNVETACKKSDFCSQLGGKAEFMTYK